MKKSIVSLIVVVVIIIGIIGTKNFIQKRNIRLGENSKTYIYDNQASEENITKEQPKKLYNCYTDSFTYVYNMDNSDMKVIISNRQELEEYKNKFVIGGKYNEDGFQSSDSEETLNRCLEKYNDEYFKDKSIALVYVVFGNSTEFIEKTEAEIQENTVKINCVMGSNGDIGLCVMGASIIITEVDKGIDTIDFYTKAKE